jgi:WD40 repeat protein
VPIVTDRPAHARISAALRSLGERSGWLSVNPYLLRHLAVHAGLGDVLDQLLTVPDFLIATDPAAVLPHLHLASTDAARAVARLYQRVAHELVAVPPATRAAILQSAAMRDEPDLAGSLSFSIEPVWRILWADAPTPVHRTLTGHSQGVNALAGATTRYRTHLVSGAEDGIRVWDASSGLLVTELPGHSNGPVTALACWVVENDRLLLASAGYDDIVRVWDVDSRRQLAELRGHTEYPTCLVWVPAPDGALQLVSGSMDGTLRWWDVARQEAVRIIVADSTGVTDLVAVDATQHRRVLVSSGRRSAIRLWDPVTGSDVGVLKDHPSSVRALATCLDAGGHVVLASGGDHDTIRFWDVDKGSLVGSIKHSAHSSPLALVTLRDGRTVFATPVNREGLSSPVGLYSLDGSPVAVLEGHTLVLNALVGLELPDGRIVLASGSGDKTIRLWELSHLDGLAVQGSASVHVRSIAVFEDGDHGATVVAGGSDGRLRYLEMTSGTLWAMRPAHDAAITEVARHFWYDEREVLVTVGRGDDVIRTWDPATTDPLDTYPGPADCGVALVTDAQGRRLLVTRPRMGLPSPLVLRLLDVDTREERRATFREGSGIWSVASTTLISGDNVLAMGDHNGTIRVWNLTADSIDLWVSVPVLFYGVHAIRFLHLSDGHTWLIAITDAAYVWDLTTGRRVHVLEGHTSYLTCLDITASADGLPVLVTGSPDRTLRVWDLIAGRHVATILLEHAVLGLLRAPDLKH